MDDEKMKQKDKRVRFYDGAVVVMLISFVFFLLYYFKIDSYYAYKYSYILVIVALIFVISAAIMSWGMIYHEIKARDWSWLVCTIIFLLIGGIGFLVPIAYYFLVFRKTKSK